MRKIFSLLAAVMFSVAMFADSATSTFYLAINSDKVGDSDVKFCVKYGDAGSEWSGDLKMAKTEYTYEGRLIYSATYTFQYGGYYNWQFMNGTSSYVEWYAGEWNTDVKDGKMYVYDKGVWMDLTTDTPIIPAKFFITGILGSWDPAAIKSTEDSYTVKNVPAGAHAMKLTLKGNWDEGVKTMADLSDSTYLYPDQDGNVCFFLSEEADVVVKYIAGDPEVFTVTSDKMVLPSVKLIGNGAAWGNWEKDKAIALEPAVDKKSASKTFALKADEHVIFKIIRAGEWLTQEGKDNTNYGLNYGWQSVGGFYRVDDKREYLSVELVADVAGNYTFTWEYAKGLLSVSFPESRLENDYYLVGVFNGVEETSVESLTAEKKFTWNKNIGEGNEEFKIVVDLKEGDKFKAAYVYRDKITSWVPDGMDNDYVVDANHAGNGKTIYFQQKYNDTFGGHFWIDPNTATAIDNAAVEAKAIKRFENGQLVIIKNGVKYNAQGAVVK